MTRTEPVSGSFRDPSGFLFLRDAILHRQVNRVYQQDYDHLMSSGLYQALVDEGLLVPHVEAPPAEDEASETAYKLLRPEMLPFVSYPYEWCFSQLKDAARTTLRVQDAALRHGMILKDASAYNIQFRHGRPIFIDTLSFVRYEEGKPWVAYRQFCCHFLAPLALMSRTDHRLGSLFRVFLDGVPLGLASRALPWRTRLDLGLLTHVHLHARAEARFADRAAARDRAEAKVSRRGLEGILASLRSAIEKLRWRAGGTVWADYYADTNYSEGARRDKEEQLLRLLGDRRYRMIWDLGANTGEYSRIASRLADAVIAFDLDPAAVERNYLQCQADGPAGILPLVQDLTNPSPGIGWAGVERAPLAERGAPDCVLALALIHHLAIGNNVPLPRIAEYLAGLAPRLILEFVPKRDSQIQRMLSSRQDIFADYHRRGFEEAFGPHFEIRENVQLAESERRLYLLERRPD